MVNTVINAFFVAKQFFEKAAHSVLIRAEAPGKRIAYFPVSSKQCLDGKSVFR